MKSSKSITAVLLICLTTFILEAERKVMDQWLSTAEDASIDLVSMQVLLDEAIHQTECEEGTEM